MKSLWCWFWGIHSWTSKAEQGVKPDPGERFEVYAAMFCRRCGFVHTGKPGPWPGFVILAWGVVGVALLILLSRTISAAIS